MFFERGSSGTIQPQAVMREGQDGAKFSPVSFRYSACSPRHAD
jgi:hypothetical protein